jgi:CheY-like chemotaxis protein
LEKLLKSRPFSYHANFITSHHGRFGTIPNFGLKMVSIISNGNKMATKTDNKIYVVDDDPFYLATYDKHLRAQGYTNISCFLSGKDFLEQLTDEPDIVILDHDLGDMTGLDVLKEIKRFNTNIFVIFASARQQPEIATASLKNGAFDYIIKDDNVLEHITSTLSKLFVVQDYLKKKKRNNRFFFFFSLVVATMMIVSFLHDMLRH